MNKHSFVRIACCLGLWLAGTACFLIGGSSSFAQDGPPKSPFGVAAPQDVPGAVRKAVSPGMHEVTMVDSKGFSQPIPVATIQIPSQWLTRGGIDWDNKAQCIGNIMRMGWAAFAADGSQGFEIRPGYTWQVQGTEMRFNPCSPVPINSAREFLSMVVHQRYGERARILKYQDRPDLTQGMKSDPRFAPPRFEGGEMLIGYSRDGREYRESLSTTVTFTNMQGNIMGGAAILYTQFALEGKLDTELGDRIRRSMQLNKQWTDRWAQVTRAAADRIAAEQSRGITAWHNDRMNAINLKGASDRSQIRMQTQRDISQIYSNTWQSTQATDDRMHRRSLEAIGEYNTYRDPGSNTPVRATIHNKHVWKVGVGNYVSTNDSSFKPNNGVELTKIP
jgi:hypothetical protein